MPETPTTGLMQCEDCGHHFQISPRGEVQVGACPDCGGKRLFRMQPNPVQSEGTLRNMVDMETGKDAGGNPDGEGILAPPSGRAILTAFTGEDVTTCSHCGWKTYLQPGESACPKCHWPFEVDPSSGIPDELRGQIAGAPLTEGGIMQTEHTDPLDTGTHGRDEYTHGHVLAAAATPMPIIPPPREPEEIDVPGYQGPERRQMPRPIERRQKPRTMETYLEELWKQQAREREEAGGMGVIVTPYGAPEGKYGAEITGPINMLQGQCRQCGGDLLEFVDGHTVCDHCGQQSPPMHQNIPYAQISPHQGYPETPTFKSPKPPTFIQRMFARTAAEGEHQGWTNFETWHTKAMLDNDRHLYEQQKKMTEEGWTPEQIRNWTVKHVIGPENKRKLEDAQEWNEIPEPERTDPRYEEVAEKSPQHKKIMEDWFGGPDLSDDTPNLIDPELVNWDEIHHNIHAEHDEEQQYEEEDQRLKGEGLTHGMPGHSDETNKMLDAWMKHHGVPDENTPHYENPIHVPIEHLEQGYGQYRYPEDYGEPHAAEIAQQGYWKEPIRDLGWHTLNRVQKGLETPYAKTMRQALVGQGYPPEQIQHIMRPQWRQVPGKVPDGPIGSKPGLTWERIEEEPPKGPDPRLDQPGKDVFPSEWTSRTAALDPCPGCGGSIVAGAEPVEGGNWEQVYKCRNCKRVWRDQEYTHPKETILPEDSSPIGRDEPYVPRYALPGQSKNPRPDEWSRYPIPMIPTELEHMDLGPVHQGAFDVLAALAGHWENLPGGGQEYRKTDPTDNLRCPRCHDQVMVDHGPAEAVFCPNCNKEWPIHRDEPWGNQHFIPAKLEEMAARGDRMTPQTMDFGPVHQGANETEGVVFADTPAQKNNMNWTPGMYGRGLVIGGEPHTWTTYDADHSYPPGRDPLSHSEYPESLGVAPEHVDWMSGIEIRPNGEVSDEFKRKDLTPFIAADPRLKEVEEKTPPDPTMANYSRTNNMEPYDALWTREAELLEDIAPYAIGAGLMAGGIALAPETGGASLALDAAGASELGAGAAEGGAAAADAGGASGGIGGLMKGALKGAPGKITKGLGIQEGLGMGEKALGLGNSGGGAGGGGTAPYQSPLQQFTHVLAAFVESDYETPSSVPDIGVKHDDPEDVDQKEFNDQDKSPENPKNPNLQDSGASGEDQVRKDMGKPSQGQFSPDSPAIRRMEMLMPLIEKYYHSEESGANDPMIKQLHEELEAEVPGYLSQADEEAAERYMQSRKQPHEHVHATVHKAIMPPMQQGNLQAQQQALDPTGLNPSQQPQAPSSAVPPGGAAQQGHCSKCGGVTNPDGSCPQCGAQAQAGSQLPGGPSVAPNPQTFAHTDLLASLVDSANHQGPVTPEQIAAVQQYLIQQGRVDEVPNVPLDPGNPEYAKILAEIQQNPETVPTVTPEEQTQPPAPQPAAPGGMPVPGMAPGEAGAQPMQPMSSFLPDFFAADGDDEDEEDTLTEWERKMVQDGKAKRDGSGIVLFNPDMHTPPEKESKTAADNIAPRCPKCGSATTGIIGDQDHHAKCHACHNIWKMGDVFSDENYGQTAVAKVALRDDRPYGGQGEQANPVGVPAADQSQQTNQGNDEDSSLTWQDTAGAPLKAGQTYQMINPSYSLPDLVRVERVKPDGLDVTLLGTFANDPSQHDPNTLTSSTPISKEDADLQQLSFEPVNQNADDQNNEPPPGSAAPGLAQIPPSGQTTDEHAAQEPEMATHASVHDDDCPRCGHREFTSAMITPEATEHNCFRCGHDWVTEEKPMEYEAGVDLSYIMEDEDAEDFSQRRIEMARAGAQSRSLAEVAEKDDRLRAVRGYLTREGKERQERLAGKHFTPREQRELIDEDGEARNSDLLDLAGTHYKTSYEQDRVDPGRVRDSDLFLGV